MKTTILFLLITGLLYSCSNNGQSNNLQEAKKMESAIQQTKPGAVATSTAGYKMELILNGTPWAATSMMPVKIGSRIIGYYKDQYIALPYSETDMVVGKKIPIGDDADLLLNDGCLWTNTKGEMEITKVDSKTSEGKFSFTTFCSSTNKKVEITNGFFRIVL